MKLNQLKKVLKGLVKWLFSDNDYEDIEEDALGFYTLSWISEEGCGD